MKRYLIPINFLLALTLTACNQGIDPQAPTIDNSASDLVIRLEQSSSQFAPALYSVANEAREDLIRSVSVYVFSEEALTKAAHFGPMQSGGHLRVPLSVSTQNRSVFVVANVKIQNPTSKSELLKMMSDVEIGADGIPVGGMPMASAELEITPGSRTVVEAALQRCHSVLYVATPNGKNSDYSILLNAEQRLQGPLIVGNTALASPDTNNPGFTENYTLTDVSTPEPVAYFYPTDGSVTISIRLAGKGDTFHELTIDSDKAKMRNKKYLLRITGSPAASSLRESNVDFPQVELLTE